jgi:uncharacterized Zn-binding protein involved in type VI secretion
VGLPAAKQGDRVVALDTHIVVPPAPAPPLALPFPFTGMLTGGLSSDVKISGRAAATVGSTAQNLPPHVPGAGAFQKPPANKGTVQAGSPTVRINGKPAARHGDTCVTCNDPADLPAGKIVVAAGTVRIG